MAGGGQKNVTIKTANNSSRVNPHRVVSGTGTRTAQRSSSNKKPGAIVDASKTSGKALSINRTPKSEISQPGKIFVLNSQ